MTVNALVILILFLLLYIVFRDEDKSAQKRRSSKRYKVGLDANYNRL